MIRVRVFKAGRRAAFAVALTTLCTLLAGTSTALADNTPAAASGAWQGAATQAHARSMTVGRTVSPLFTCPDRSICLYPNDDYTGNYPGGSPVVILPDLNVPPSGIWHTFGYVGADSPNPGSINNDSGSSIFAYDKQEPVEPGLNPICYVPGRYVLDHMYGHFELFYSDSTCAHHYTTPLP